MTEPKNVESKLNIFQKMAKATFEIGTVAKKLEVATKTDSDGRTLKSYKAVSSADVLSAVRPIESELGIYSYPISTKVIESQVLITVKDYKGNKSESRQLHMRIETVYRFVDIDNPSDFIEVTTLGDGVDSQDKAPGKSMTYADKYALLRAYKINTGDDPDKDASQELKGVEKKGYVEPEPEEELTQHQKRLNWLSQVFSSDKGKLQLPNYLETFKVKSLSELTEVQAEDLVSTIRANAKPKQ